ncbi:MAG: hypothetical protein U9Q22_02435, partial [Candidatus Altiarchaeota archaeon]|nr:hypothetical protein [Candidatus Altiarchaeota archaeon]
DSTSIDSNLRKGDSGILNLVIQNTGGRRAEDVEVWLPDTTQIHVNKRFYIGRMEAGQSKTLPITVSVDSEALTGLRAIPVKISYDGFDSQGDRENNLLTTWEIPVRVYSDPLFQITPLKTTYFKDNLDELMFKGLTKDSVKDLEATLSSSCATIIGSSRKFVGDVKANQNFDIAYEIKPSSSGACTASLTMSYTDEAGTRVSDDITIGLNIEDAPVDFKVINISYNPTGPGETVTLKIGLRNVGKSDSTDTTVGLSLSEPFAPVDTPEKYIGKVLGGQGVDVEFKVAVGWDAETKTYTIPLVVDYKVGGTVYSIRKDIGMDVGGKIILEIIKVESSRGMVRVEVANIGTRTADGVKATLVTQGEIWGKTPDDARAKKSNTSARDGLRQRNISQTKEAQQLVSYKSDIKPNKQTTFTFNTQAAGQAMLSLEYTGLGNKRVKQNERITIRGSDVAGGVSISSKMKRGGGTSITTYALYTLVVLILVFVAYKVYSRRKSK